MYSLEIRAADQAGNIANRAHAFEIDQTPPITTIIQKPSPLSNQQISTLTFTCNEESCSFECQLNSTASQGSASSCNRGMFATPILQHSAEYTFIVTATDQVGNRGESTTYTWETDFQSPLIFGVDNTTVQCSMATPEHTGFARAEDDKSENISVMYGDINLGCSIKRTWTAVDEAGNAGFLVQNIDLEFLPTLSLSPQVALPCDSTSSSAQVPPVQHLPLIHVTSQYNSHTQTLFMNTCALIILCVTGLPQSAEEAYPSHRVLFCTTSVHLMLVEEMRVFLVAYALLGNASVISHGMEKTAAISFTHQ